MSSAASGAWIRELRKRLGLSQVELAALLGTSNVTVNRWENDRASPQPTTIQRLRDLEQGGVAPSASPAAGRVGNLPASFAPVIGRQRDLDAVVAAVEQHPLVTIVGPAGTGKTTLALEVGRATRERWPDGAWFIDLAVALEPDDVVHVVAREIGIREAGRKSLPERITAEFATREILLILDNCEHLVAACAQLAADMMRIPSRSRMLATSRVPLSVPGESVSPLRPLAATDAAALFLSQVREHQPALMPGDEEWRAIEDICRRLDCLPLAIELAAARARVLSVEQIAGRLDQRFDLLRTTQPLPARQRALETAIAWSYDLLEASEARLFRHLGAFVGWFDLPAVEMVAASRGALDLLEGLARQSMIVIEHDPAARSARYRLLESLAEYARRELDQHGETAEAMLSHAVYYSNLAREQAARLRGQQGAALAVLDRERDNLIASLEWLLAAGEAERALALAASLGSFWRLRGRYAEGIAWLERALGSADDLPAGPRLEAMNQLALLHYHTGRLDEAERTLTTAVTLAQDQAEPGHEARALDTLGLVQMAKQDLERAAVSYRAALALFQEHGERGGAALSRLHLGHIENLQGNHAATERAYQEAWSLVQGTNDLAAEALILSNLGEIAARTARYRRALGYYEQSLARWRVVGNPDRLAVVGANTAEVRLVLGDAVEALALIETAAAQFRAVGNPAHLAATVYLQSAALAALGRHDEALSLMRESLDLYHQMGDWIDVVYALEAIVRLLAAGDDASHAARLLGGAEALREREQVADYPLFDRTAAEEVLRATLGEQEYTERWEEGHHLLAEEVVAEAMFVGGAPDGPPIQMLVIQQRPRAVLPEADALTSRQVEVLRMVAAGLSNREIGRALAISDRTVERHLTAIYGALDVDRRSAAVARATSRGLLGDRAS